MTKTDEFLKIEEVANILRVSIHTVYSWINQGKIPCVHLNGTKRIPKNAFDRWLKKHTCDPLAKRL